MVNAFVERPGGLEDACDLAGAGGVIRSACLRRELRRGGDLLAARAAEAALRRNTAQAERKATVNSDACSRALRQVRWPAIGLIVSSLASPFMLGIMIASGKIQAGSWMLIPFILQLILVVLAALGGWKMLHLESRWMAMVGAIAG